MTTHFYGKKILVFFTIRCSCQSCRRAVMWNGCQNLFFDFIYNALGVLIAASVLPPFFGVLLSPMITGAAMSSSSVSVIAIALRLRRLRSYRVFDRLATFACLS